MENKASGEKAVREIRRQTRRALAGADQFPEQRRRCRYWPNSQLVRSIRQNGWLGSKTCRPCCKASIRTLSSAMNAAVLARCSCLISSDSEAPSWSQSSAPPDRQRTWPAPSGWSESQITAAPYTETVWDG